MALQPPRCTALLLVSLLLLHLCISHAAQEAATSGSTSGQPLQEQHGEVEVEEQCGGGGGGGGGGEEEECLMRRTLVAHTDYIYTQGNHN